ncbi:MAG: flagellar basal body P-ring protein FlgI [Planctomycetota bacterium]
MCIPALAAVLAGFLTIQNNPSRPSVANAPVAAPPVTTNPAAGTAEATKPAAGGFANSVTAAQVQTQSSAVAIPISSLTVVRGIRENQITGWGIVVGLSGTGDTSNFAKQQIQNLAKTVGLTVSSQDLASNNIAIVNVSATLPAYPEPGKRIDVIVSSYQDAKSLEGGFLVRTPLTGAIGGEAVAVAQGSLILGGYTAGGQAASVKKNHTTSGFVPRGAILESGSALARMKPLTEGNNLYFDLKQEEAEVADKIAKAINVIYPSAAIALNPGTVRVAVPANYDEASGNFPGFLATIQRLSVVPYERPTVSLDEKTGTVLITGNPQLSPCIIVRGNLTITIAESPKVSQPNPFGAGDTTTTPRTSVSAKEEIKALSVLPSTSTLNDLAQALSSLGATPRELVGILAQLQRTGALYADILPN